MRDATSVEPLGLYLHVPFCRHACPYCDFYKMELRDRPARTRLEFPGRLAHEHELLHRFEPSLAARPLDTIYFGGGTPSVLSPAGVAELIRELRARHAPSTPEVTLEANPENLTPARCDAWRAAGITRLSIGVQSFAERDLARLERLHAPATISIAVANARGAGFDNLSLDLMFALPGQTHAEWLANLRRAVDLGPQHLSFYGLTIHEGTPFDEEFAAGALVLPDDDQQAAMYLDGAALLAGAGFEHYEISNFARPGFRSRHNQRYWRRDDVLGLGPGAHSSLGASRWQNPDDLDAWVAATDAGDLARVEVEELDLAGRTRERLFTGLRRIEGVREADGEDWELAREWLGTPPGARALADGLCVASTDAVRLTPAGWIVSDAIIGSILALQRR